MKALPIAVLALCSGIAAFGQSVISARSGLVHYVEGRVLLDDKAIESKFGSFPELKENSVLKTEDGRAEVLLTPGVFLRVGESSSVRMITNRLIDTRLELLAGSAVLEAADFGKDNAVTIAYKDTATKVDKKGIYRFDTDPAQLRVYDGEAQVTAAGKTIEVKEGKLVSLDGELALAKFDKNTGDALNHWSRRRAEGISLANVSAARSVNSYSGGGSSLNGWLWNPYFGMFTYVPYRSIYSPYGFRYWNPLDAYEFGYGYYYPRYYYGGGGGTRASVQPSYRTMTPTRSGHSGTVAAASSAPSVRAPAANSSAGAAHSAPISRGSGSAGGRGR
jgi:hypothetical protein